MAKIKELVVTEFKGSDTEQNLAKAFVDEASGYFKYSLYAVLAKYEGQDYISKIFEDIAQNEKEHAKIWFKWLNDGKFPKTLKNLKDAIELENNAVTAEYPEFINKAKEEGFEHLAGLFEKIAEIEKNHLEKFKKLKQSLENELNIPADTTPMLWECSACGAVIEQDTRPDYCPLCAHEDTFFFKKNPR